MSPIPSEVPRTEKSGCGRLIGRALIVLFAVPLPFLYDHSREALVAFWHWPPEGWGPDIGLRFAILAILLPWLVGTLLIAAWFRMRRASRQEDAARTLKRIGTVVAVWTLLVMYINWAVCAFLYALLNPAPGPGYRS